MGSPLPSQKFLMRSLLSKMWKFGWKCANRKIPAIFADEYFKNTVNFLPKNVLSVWVTVLECLKLYNKGDSYCFNNFSRKIKFKILNCPNLVSRILGFDLKRQSDFSSWRYVFKKKTDKIFIKKWGGVVSHLKSTWYVGFVSERICQ